MSELYGQQGPPPAQGGPDIMQALQGLAPLAPGPEAAPPEEDPTEILRQLLDLSDRYRAQEQSQQNILLMEKISTMAQQILANEEKEMDGMMQGKMPPSAVRRAIGG